MNKDQPHFDISASVVRQLGEDLITDEVTALMELVKNAYDADATWVRIEINCEEFSNEEKLFFKKNKGFIIIEDDGFGMSYTDIVDSWLKISFSKKRKMKLAGELTPKERTPLGDKGLGRLSSQKLGHKLDVFTIKDGKNKVQHIAFDWNDFKDNVSLTSVNVFSESLRKSYREKGTLLVIQGLNNPKVWYSDSAEKIKGQLSQLIFPYKDKRPFNVYLKINGEQILLDELNKKVRSRAISSLDFNYKNGKIFIQGEMKFSKLRKGNSKTNLEVLEKLVIIDKGKDFFGFLTNTILNKKYSIPKAKYIGEENVFISFNKTVQLHELANVSFDENNKLADPGSFSGEIDEYSLNQEDGIESVFDDFAQYKAIIKNQVGVRVFRNGFGVKPYGLGGQDWLGLSKGQTSGSSFYGLRPNNIIGFVEISANENKQLQEKTDREGFVDNSYSKNFHLILNHIVSYVNTVIEKSKRSFNEYIKLNSSKEGGITNLSEGYNLLRTTANQSSKISDEVVGLESRLDTISSEIDEIVERTQETPLFSSDEEHKLRPLLEKVNGQIKNTRDILSQLNILLPGAKRLSQLADVIEPTIVGLEKQLADFSELAGLGLTAEALTHEIAQITNNLNIRSDKIYSKLQKNDYSTAQIFSYIEFVRSSSSSLKKQISHLAPSLRYVREKSENIDLNAFVEGLKDYYKDRFAKRKIQIIVEGSKRTFHVKFNRGKLTQIFDNIILNSEFWLIEKLKQKPSFKPKITIELRPPFVRIFDNGFGISIEIADTVFQPFITTKPKEKGRGLGLFIVDQFMESEDCSIFLRSDLNETGNKYIFQLDFNSVFYE